MLVFKDASTCKDINSLTQLPTKVNGMGGDLEMTGGYNKTRQRHYQFNKENS